MDITIKQGATLIATGNFSLRKARASKTMNVRTGDRFWVTTSTLSNERGIACSRVRVGRPRHRIATKGNNHDHQTTGQLLARTARRSG